MWGTWMTGRQATHQSGLQLEYARIRRDRIAADANFDADR